MDLQLGAPTPGGYDREALAAAALCRFRRVPFELHARLGPGHEPGALAALAGAAVGATCVWSGLMSVYFTFAVGISFGGLTFSLRLGEWYSVNTVLSAVFVLAFPAVGCWLAIAGQPIFRDVPGRPQTA